jgi:hypothetical protein
MGYPDSSHVHWDETKLIAKQIECGVYFASIHHMKLLAHKINLL